MYVKPGKPRKMVKSKGGHVSKLMKEETRVHCFVSGTVQGIGYRFFVRGQAEKLGVRGWVKNLRDGRVEVVVEGGSERVANFLKSLKDDAPDEAAIENISTNYESARGEKDFQIRF